MALYRRAIDAHLHCRETGGGPRVMLLHCSAGSGAQWRTLASQLAAHFRVLAPDLAGYGASPARAQGDFATLTGHALALARLVDAEPGPLHLVGHSFGGAVALRLAMLLGERVCSLSLIEPVAFQLLRGAGGDAGAYAVVRGIARAMAADLSAGNGAAAMHRFVDFWNGEGNWAAMDGDRRAQLAAQAAQVVADFDAIEAEPTRRAALRAISAPTLVLQGGRSPAPAALAVRRVAEAIPGAQRVRLRDAGHMAPLTHAEMVNLLLTAHLELAQERARGRRNRTHGARLARETTPAADPIRRHGARPQRPIIAA